MRILANGRGPADRFAQDVRGVAAQLRQRVVEHRLQVVVGQLQRTVEQPVLDLLDPCQRLGPQGVEARGQALSGQRQSSGHQREEPDQGDAHGQSARDCKP